MFLHLVGVNGWARGYESRPPGSEEKVQNSIATAAERTGV